MIKRLLIIFSLVFLSILVSSGKTEAQSCTPVFPATTCSVTDSITIIATVPETTVTFSDYAPISSVVYIKEGGYIIGSVVTLSSGVFTKTVTSIPGAHTYSIYLIDTVGRTTPETILETVTLSTHIDLPISTINLPPTISISKTKITQGESVSISGQGAPGSTVDIYINNVNKFSYLVGSDSNWVFSPSVSDLSDKNSFYAISNRSGLNPSVKSQVVSLEITACTGANCNHITQPPTSAATPATTAAPTQKTYNFKLEIGENLRNFILLTSIFISVFGLIIFFLILLLRRPQG